MELFNLPDAGALTCKIVQMRRGHLSVELRDADGMHRYTALFSSVAYLRCPAAWRGAGFREGTQEERLDFLNRVPVERLNQWHAKGLDPITEFFQQYRMVIGSTQPIVIVCEDVHVKGMA